MHQFLNFLCYFEKQQKIDFIWNHKLPTSNVHHNKPGAWLKSPIDQSTHLWPISAIGKSYQSTWALTCVGCSVPGPGSVPGKPGYRTTPIPTRVRGITGTCCCTLAYTSPSRQENIKLSHSSCLMQYNPIWSIHRTMTIPEHLSSWGRVFQPEEKKCTMYTCFF